MEAISCVERSASSKSTRRKLLDAATQAFAETGYRVCVDDIARLAGVAKQTLYHHFSGKDELFAEAAKQMAKEILVALDQPGGDLRQSLLNFALAYREKVLGDAGISIHRVLVAEAPRLPQLAQAVFAAAFGETTRRLAERFGQAMASGQLRQDDPFFATDMFLSMLAGMERSRRLLASSIPSDAAPDRAERIVDCFLLAFAPDPASCTASRTTSVKSAS